MFECIDMKSWVIIGVLYTWKQFWYGRENLARCTNLPESILQSELEKLEELKIVTYLIDSEDDGFYLNEQELEAVMEMVVKIYQTQEKEEHYGIK